jgi:hypothetical protein
MTTRKRSLAIVALLAATAVFVAGACSKTDHSGVVEPPADSSQLPPPPPPPVVTIAVAPAAVAFSDTLGTPNPGPAVVNVTSTGTGEARHVRIGTISYAGPVAGWLSFTQQGDSAPASVSLQVSMAGLAAGTYTATVPVMADSATNAPQSVSVTFTLAAAAPPPPPPPPPPPTGSVVTIAAVGNMGACLNDLARATSTVVANAHPDYLFMLGDNVPARTTRVTTLQDYQDCFEPTLGAFKSVTYAALGESETDLDTTSATAGMAAGADAYFGASRVGPPGKNYFSFDLGSWHIIVLNIQSGGPKRPIHLRYNAGSEQLNWLYADLDAHKNQCTLAIWHDPMWMSASDPASPTDPLPNHDYRNQPIRGIWTALYEKGADLVVNSGMHIYERFAPMRYAEGYQHPTPSEYAADSARGIRQITSGLGGNGPIHADPPLVTHPLSEYRSGGNGVLKLTLGNGTYTWQFLNTQWSSIQDQGTGTCH